MRRLEILGALALITGVLSSDLEVMAARGSQALIASNAQFAAAQATSTAQAKTSGRLTGVYRAPEETGRASSQGPNQGRFFYLTFFPDGRVRRTRPEVGLQGFDDAYQMNLDFRSGVPNYVRRWGTYRVAGEQGQILFANRDTWSFDLKEYPQSIQAQGRTYVLLDSGDGLKLQGTYKSTKDDSFITFMPDGKMNQEGVVANCVSGGQHYGVNSHGVVTSNSAAMLCVAKPLPGGYSIGNYTIKLIFSNSSNAFAFWAEPTSNRTNPPALYIDNIRYDLAQ